MRGRSGAREFSAEIRLPAPLDKVFPFFADAANLQVLTPPWLHYVVPLDFLVHDWLVRPDLDRRNAHVH